MKKIIAGLVGIITLTLLERSLPAQISCCDGISPNTRTVLNSINVSFENQKVLVEGQPSNPYSSARREPDYFLVPSTNSNGIRILRMTPFTTRDFRPFIGIEETNLVLTDIVSQEVFTLPLSKHEDQFGISTHDTTMIFEGRRFYARVAYAGPRNPYVILTWGSEAANGSVGSFGDTFCDGIVEKYGDNCNGISPYVQSVLNRISVSFQNQKVLVEGQPSNPYSSIRGEPDYFMVSSFSSNCARVLRMNPHDITFGFTNAVFLDVVSREVFRVPLNRYQGSNGVPFHDGTITIDGRPVYIRVMYQAYHKYPYTVLTWGKEATNGSAGAYVDDLCLGVIEKIKTPVVVELEKLAAALSVSNQQLSNQVLQCSREKEQLATLIGDMKMKIDTLQLQISNCTPATESRIITIGRLGGVSDEIYAPNIKISDLPAYRFVHRHRQYTSLSAFVGEKLVPFGELQKEGPDGWTNMFPLPLKLHLKKGTYIFMPHWETINLSQEGR